MKLTKHTDVDELFSDAGYIDVDGNRKIAIFRPAI
jgi:hypothetical protein